MEESTTVKQIPAEDPGEYDDEGAGYAASWWTNLRGDGELAHESLPRDAFWAQGHDGQRMYVLPSENVVVVRMGFTPVSRDLELIQLLEAVTAGP